LRAFTRPLKEIHEFGETVLPKLQATLGQGFRLMLEESTCQIGSGALPTEALPTIVIAVANKNLSVTRIAESFRLANPPIIGRIKDDRFLLDLRTIFDSNDLIPNFTERDLGE
jgi:L-seryl-tRNA(Ser) seleniumtransferase